MKAERNYQLKNDLIYESDAIIFSVIKSVFICVKAGPFCAYSVELNRWLTPVIETL